MCQFCKQERDCKRGPDPFLLLYFHERETVWLCADCYSLREEGDHLPDECFDLETP
jgi:hypothetical protein